VRPTPARSPDHIRTQHRTGLSRATLGCRHVAPAAALAAAALAALAAVAAESPEPADLRGGDPTQGDPGVGQGHGAIEIELNKLAPSGDACRPYLVFRNQGETTRDALTLELVLFDADGFILRHFTLDAAPLAAGKTSVKLFEIPGVACNAIGRILLNQVNACAGADGALDDCLRRIRAASRLPVDFFK
jgi:hypothetical protein